MKHLSVLFALALTAGCGDDQEASPPPDGMPVGMRLASIKVFHTSPDYPTPSPFTLTMVYDEDNRLEVVDTPFVSGGPTKYFFDYDDEGRLTKLAGEREELLTWDGDRPAALQVDERILDLVYESDRLTVARVGDEDASLLHYDDQGRLSAIVTGDLIFPTTFTYEDDVLVEGSDYGLPVRFEVENGRIERVRRGADLYNISYNADGLIDRIVIKDSAPYTHTVEYTYASEPSADGVILAPLLPLGRFFRMDGTPRSTIALNAIAVDILDFSPTTLTF